MKRSKIIKHIISNDLYLEVEKIMFSQLLTVGVNGGHI